MRRKCKARKYTHRGVHPGQGYGTLSSPEEGETIEYTGRIRLAFAAAIFLWHASSLHGKCIGLIRRRQLAKQKLIEKRIEVCFETKKLLE